jgi:hypothetical protein
MGFAPVFAQGGNGSSSAMASVTLSHNFSITTYGFGVLNDSFTFNNNGTSAVQIPTLQVGLPSNVTSKAAGGLVLTPGGQFSLSQSAGSNGTTIVTITPDTPTLNAGANSTVALKAFVSGVFNFSSKAYGTWAYANVPLIPSLNVNVTALNSAIILPSGGVFTPTPLGFTESAAGNVYTLNQTSIKPAIAAGNLNFSDTDQSEFTPIAVSSLVRTIVPASNGAPTVQDQFSIENLASYSISEVKLDFLQPGITSVTLLPSTEPPVVNSEPVIVSGGLISFPSTALGAPLLTMSNITFTVSYPVPSSDISVSGNTVKITIPDAPFIAAPVPSYLIQLSPSKGVAAVGPTTIENGPASPFTTGSGVLSYSVALGWAANQAIPAGALVFAVAFGMFAIQRPATKGEEEEEEESFETAEVLKAFEDKTGLETQDMSELASAPKGSKTRADFERMRNEINDLRGRAMQRYGELRRDLGSGKQFDLLTQVGEAEREEDRAFRDLLNLYVQYHGNRMNEATFKRLQPTYRRRVEAAINRLSDLLHQVQTEEK